LVPVQDFVDVNYADDNVDFCPIGLDTSHLGKEKVRPGRMVGVQKVIFDVFGVIIFFHCSS